MKKRVKKTILRALDPHLGYGYLSECDLKLYENEFFRDGHIQLGTGKTTIAVTGGSTSDVAYEDSWPRALQKLLVDQGYSTSLLIGAVSGYSSGQEVIKFIRDLLPLRPDILISFSGINDIGCLQAASVNHPMVHHHQKNLMQSLIPERGRWNFGKAPPSKNTASGLALGKSSDNSPAECWYTNMKILDAISKTFGASFCAFLQPVAGIGAHTLTDHESKVLQEYCQERLPFDYKKAMLEFYTEAQTKASYSSGLVIDLVDIFSEHEKVYADVRHPNGVGNRIIADHIFDHLKPLLDQE